MTDGLDRAPDAGLGPAERIRLMVDLYNARELDRMVDLIPEGFVHDMRGTGVPGMETYHGPAGYRRFLEEWLEAFPESQLEIESIETEGETVLAIIRQDMRGAGGGVPVTFRYAALSLFRDGDGVGNEFHTDLDHARARFAEIAQPERAEP